MDSCGHTFERSSILSFLSRRPYCPISRKPLSFADLIPNDALSERMDKWKWQQEYYNNNREGGGQILLREFVDVELQAPPSSSRANQVESVARDESNTDGEDDVPVPPPRRRRRWRHFRDGYAYGSVHPQRSSRTQRIPADGPITPAGASGWCDFDKPDTIVHWSHPLSSGPEKSQSSSPVTVAAELMLLPQELHVLRMMEERSRTQNERRRRVQALRTAVRFAVLTMVLLLASAAVLSVGFLWQFGYLFPQGRDGEGEDEDAQQDEYLNDTTSNRTSLRENSQTP